MTARFSINILPVSKETTHLYYYSLYNLFCSSVLVYSNKAKTTRFTCPENSTAEAASDHISQSKQKLNFFLNATGVSKIRRIYGFFCSLFFSDQFLVVTNGGANVKTKVFKIHHQEGTVLMECAHSLESPVELQWPTGGVMSHPSEDFIVVICGGQDSDEIENARCFSLGNPNSQWQFVEQMEHTRVGAASLVISNGNQIWITGGERLNLGLVYETTMTTETVELNEKGDGLILKEGPYLPKSIRHHCLELIGANVALLFGGEIFVHGLGDSLSTWIETLTWSVNLETMSWTLLTQMNVPRWKQSCSVLRDPSTDRTIVVAAGGNMITHELTHDKTKASKSVELLVLNDDDVNENIHLRSRSEWQHGPEMPVGLRDAPSTTSADQLRMYVTGGSQGLVGSVDWNTLSTIFELQCPGMQCMWRTVYEMDKEMSMGVVFSIPPPPVPKASWQSSEPCPYFNKVTGNSIVFNTLYKVWTFFHPGLGLLLLSTGNNMYAELSDTEAFTILPSGELNACSTHHHGNNLDMPVTMMRPSGGLLRLQDSLQYRPVLCGGRSQGIVIADCFQLGSNEEEPLGRLLLSRHDAASVVIRDGTTLWVTGGRKMDQALDSTELLELSSNADDGSETLINQASSSPTTLPYPMSSHCLQVVGGNTVILYGGASFEIGLIFSSSWLAENSDSQPVSWMEGASMAEARYDHMCGVIKTSEEAVIVVAAGGIVDFSDKWTSTVKFLFVEENSDSAINDWQSGPNLPVTLSQAASATTPDQRRLFVAGGRMSNLLDSLYVFCLRCLDEVNGCEWVKTEAEIWKGRSSSFAIIIPPDTTEIDSQKETTEAIIETNLCDLQSVTRSEN